MYSRLECTAEEAAEASAEEGAQEKSFTLQGNGFGCDIAIDVLFRCRSNDARQRGIRANRDMLNCDPTPAAKDGQIKVHSCNKSRHVTSFYHYNKSRHVTTIKATAATEAAAAATAAAAASTA